MKRVSHFGSGIVPFVTPKRATAMSALGQKQTSRHLQPMSALPPKVDIRNHPVFVEVAPAIAQRPLTPSALAQAACDIADDPSRLVFTEQASGPRAWPVLEHKNCPRQWEPARRSGHDFGTTRLRLRESALRWSETIKEPKVLISRDYSTIPVIVEPA